MRMNIPTGALVERFLSYLLAHPERFARSEVPCSLQDLWELALEESSASDSTVREPHVQFPCSRIRNSHTSLA